MIEDNDFVCLVFVAAHDWQKYFNDQNNYFALQY